MVLAVQLIYSIAIMVLGKALAHQIDVLRNPYLVFRFDMISGWADIKDFRGLFASNILVLYHYTVFSLACFYASYFLHFKNVSYKPFGRQIWDKGTRYNSGDFKHLKHTISIALKNGNRSFLYDDISPKNTIRIDRKPIANSPKGTTACENLTLAGLEMIYAHPNVPAAVTGHHGGQSLLHHTNNVLSELCRLSNNSKYAAPIAAFHDIGKLLTYEQKSTKILTSYKPTLLESFSIRFQPESKRAISALKPRFNKKKYWSKITNNHEAVGLTILLNTPEFWHLNPEDKNIISSVMRYKGGRLPISLENSETIQKLITNLRIADGQALQKEVTEGYSAMTDGTTNFNSIIDSLILDAVFELNIHNYKRQKHAAGWTMNNDPNLYCLISAIQTTVSQNAGLDIRNTLALDVPFKKNVYSPFRTMLIESLHRQKVLVQKVGEVSANEGIFNAKIGRTPFHEVIALNKSAICSAGNRDLPAWGESPYSIDVLINESTWKEADLSEVLDSEESLIAGIRALDK